MAKQSRPLRCPTCRTLVLAGSGDYPFCSERCRLIDLGKWASGGYVISAPIADPEMLENLQPEVPRGPQDASEDGPPRKR